MCFFSLLIKFHLNSILDARKIHLNKLQIRTIDSVWIDQLSSKMKFAILLIVSCLCISAIQAKSIERKTVEKVWGSIEEGKLLGRKTLILDQEYLPFTFTYPEVIIIQRNTLNQLTLCLYFVHIADAKWESNCWFEAHRPNPKHKSGIR